MLIDHNGLLVTARENHVYQSGKVRVTLASGHMIVIAPERIKRNYGQTNEKL